MNRPKAAPVVALCLAVAGVGGLAVLAVGPVTTGVGHSVTVDNRPSGCVEEREEPQYAKWVRERENTQADWGEWYLYDGGSVTSWSPGSGFIHPNMQYEYRPNGVTRTVEVEVPCPPTTPEPTEPTVASSSSTTSTTAAPTTTAAPSTTVGATTTTTVAPATTTTVEIPPGNCQPGGCVSENPPAVIVVCRDGVEVEIHPNDRRPTDSDDLEHCGAAPAPASPGLPATK